MKIITLCGSLKFQKEMMVVTEKMALEDNCILTPTYPVIENIEITEEQIAMLKEAHFKRIEISDAILVVNQTKNDIANYIGPNTFAEIAFAFFHNKKIPGTLHDSGGVPMYA